LLTISTGAGAAAAAGPTVSGAAALDQISIGTHNTLHGAASFERFAGVIGWQEVTDPADRTKLDNRLGAEYATFYPPDGPAKAVPISWRVERFQKVGSGSVRTHEGEAGVTPARYVNWVILELRGSGTRFIVVNTHFISGAWSGHPERQARWNRHYQVLRDKVAELRQNHPQQPVFVIGDFNRHLAMGMPAPIQYVPVQGGGQVPLDHMYAPSNISHGQVQRQPMWGSDHHAYLMYATF
jgi:endonuclease/exonuclease/phosphatase (EEP) superfamily protein YafD